MAAQPATEAYEPRDRASARPRSSRATRGSAAELLDGSSHGQVRMDKNALLIELSESDRTMFGRVDFDQQPPDQQVFSAIWELENQVNNGGLLST